jgi:hypothetical protein
MIGYESLTIHESFLESYVQINLKVELSSNTLP